MFFLALQAIAIYAFIECERYETLRYSKTPRSVAWQRGPKLKRLASSETCDGSFV